MHKDIDNLISKLSRSKYLFVFFLLLNIIDFVFIFRPSLADHLIHGLPLFAGLKYLTILGHLAYLYFIYMILSRRDKTSEDNVVLFLTGFISSAVIISSLVLGLLETNNYPNYIYTKYRVYLPYLNELANIYLITLLIYVFWLFGGILKLQKKVLARSYSLPRGWPIIFISILLLLKAVSGSYRTVMDDAKNIIAVSRSNVPREYFAYDLSDFSKKMSFIRENTDANSVIFLPPQSWDYPDIGNQVLVRFFLYPRVLVSPKKVSEFYKDYQNKNCVIFSILAESQLKSSQYYPNFDIDADKIILLEKGNIVETRDINGYGQNTINGLSNLTIGLIKHEKCGI